MSTSKKQILACIRDNDAISIAGIAAKTGLQKDLVRRHAIDSRKSGFVTSKPKVCRTHLYSITEKGSAEIISMGRTATYRAWSVPLLPGQFRGQNKIHGQEA